MKSVNSNQIKYWFLWGRENRSTRRKTSQSREENQQTRRTYDAECGKTGIRTQATLMGGACSRHCAIPVPQTHFFPILTFSSLLKAASNSATLLLSLFSLLSISASPLTPELLLLSISDFSSSLAWKITNQQSVFT